MIFTENLDHNPQAVTLEKLPDGTAWLYLRKDAHGFLLCRGNRGKHHGGG